MVLTFAIDKLIFNVGFVAFDGVGLHQLAHLCAMVLALRILLFFGLIRGRGRLFL